MAVTKKTTRQPRNEEFPVHAMVNLGTVKFDWSADDTPGVAAFRLIDEYAGKNGESAEFSFTMPGAGRYDITYSQPE